MIHDVLVEKASAKFITEVSIGEGVHRILFESEDFKITVQKDEKTPYTVVLVKVEENLPSEEPKTPDVSEDFPEECLVDLANVLLILGVKTFVWKGRMHGIREVRQNSYTHIYTYEYSKTLGHMAVYSHPKKGSVFELQEDEVTYKPVDSDLLEEVTEQAVHLNVNVGIPETWLFRTIGNNGEFVYTPLRETFNK